MKVIHGRLRHKNLKVPKDIRPACLRVKKSCFDILAKEISGKKVLDLFAGTGALGIEAISCGAVSAVFVDSSISCVNFIKQNLTQMELSAQMEVWHKDAFEAVNFFAQKGEKFDLIFLDPPYYKGMLARALQTIIEYDILSALGLLVCLCSEKDLEFLQEKSLEKLSCILERSYGQTKMYIYQKQEGSNLSRYF